MTMTQLAINAHQATRSHTVSPWEIHAQAKKRRQNNEKVVMLSMGEPDWGPPEGVAEVGKIIIEMAEPS